jgi:hypothetical protein
MVWDLGSEIRKKPTQDPGSGGQKDAGSRIRKTEKTIHLVCISTVHPCGNRILKCRQTEASPFFLPEIKKNEFLFTNDQITAKVKNGTRNLMCSCTTKGPLWKGCAYIALLQPCLQRETAG